MENNKHSNSDIAFGLILLLSIAVSGYLSWDEELYAQLFTNYVIYKNGFFAKLLSTILGTVLGTIIGSILYPLKRWIEVIGIAINGQKTYLFTGLSRIPPVAGAFIGSIIAALIILD